MSEPAAKRAKVADEREYTPPPPARSDVVWRPGPTSGREMRRFMRFVEARHPAQPPRFAGDSYDALWRWSVAEPDAFWMACWDFFGIKASAPPTAAVVPGADAASHFTGAAFFPGARLNFAENLLRFVDDRPAIVFQADCSREAETWTYARLYGEVGRCAAALRALGVAVGDRVAGFIPNTPYSVVAMLAATSLGAVWSSCSPDFGLQGVMDRFGQIAPTVLFTTAAYFYKGKRIDLLKKVGAIAGQIPSLRRVVFTPFTVGARFALNLGGVRGGAHYADFVDGHAAPTGAPGDRIAFAQLPFDHPVYIMYSSGTTGLPKCIVQGPGVLLNHLKEHVLHLDQTREDRIFYYTTTGWMMWNWLFAALAVGSTVVVWEGNPCYPKWDSLWKMAADQKLTVFGTSARYLQACMNAGCRPDRDFDLSALKVICSTGSPATDVVFDYVYEHVKPGVQFASISGGTDLNGCFALGCPLLPVHRGELQCRGLGMDVAVYGDDAKPLVGEGGELVCRTPFPSQPLYFWGDTPGRARFLGAYFEHYPVKEQPSAGEVARQTWRHGDFAMVTARGGLVIYGRSDATLNPGGVRIGTADIYRVVDETIAEIADSVIVGQKVVGADGAADTRVLLFVQMAPGHALTPALVARIRARIRAACSPRHVPALVVPCPDIPYTISGKKVELAVRACVEHPDRPLKNASALRNPDALAFFQKVDLDTAAVRPAR